VVAHNEAKYLQLTVDNLSATLPNDGEVIVVDDGSTDGSGERLEYGEQVTLLRPNRRLGAAGARNFGGRHARGAILLFSDAHVKAPEGWFTQFEEILARPNVGAAGPAYAEMDDRESKGYGLTLTDSSLNWEWLDRQNGTGTPYTVPMLGGFFLGIRREVFWEVGGFDAGLLIYGMEDMELLLRIWTYGYECVLLPDLEVAHKGPEPGAYPDYQLNWRRGLRNTLRVAVVHFGEARLQRVLKSYAKDPCFPAAMAGVLASDALKKRAEVFKTRKRDDEWFFRRFQMPV
jgi:GT2 family glycosyltransferase